MSFCSQCGSQTEAADRFCKNCGTAVQAAPPETRGAARNRREAAHPASEMKGCRGFLDRGMTFMAFPICLFGFPLVGIWFLETGAKNSDVIGPVLLLASAVFWIIAIKMGIQKLMTRAGRTR